jgi:hypothetical protein
MRRGTLIDSVCGILILGAMVLLLVSARIGQPPMAIAATVGAILIAAFQTVSARRRKCSGRVPGTHQRGESESEAAAITYAGRF